MRRSGLLPAATPAAPSKATRISAGSGLLPSWRFPVTSIDVTSADMLMELDHSLTESGVELRFAEMKDVVKDKLKRFEIFDRFGEGSFYPTIGAAVDTYLEQHAVDWKP